MMLSIGAHEAGRARNNDEMRKSHVSHWGGVIHSLRLSLWGSALNCRHQRGVGWRGSVVA